MLQNMVEKIQLNLTLFERFSFEADEILYK
jgi:hypothetical protein